jgi:stage IV sporulation protein FB
MGWENRPYYRESSGSSLPAPLHFLLFGSVPLFTVFGIRVRAHASLLLVAALYLIFGFSDEYPWPYRFEFVGILIGLVLFHEFGHCFAARSVGGDADEIVLYPLGGLASTMSPRRPGATFNTILGGPAVNAFICVACFAAMWGIGYRQSWNPWMPTYWGHAISPAAATVAIHLHLIFVISYYLLLFNLLPIYPLDGGQMLQAALWAKSSWHQSMLWACMVGMIGAVPLAVIGLLRGGGLLLTFIMANCFFNCLMQRRQLIAMGPIDFEDQVDFSQSLHEPKQRRRRRMSRRKINSLRREAAREATEATRIDSILAKVSEHGMHSLTYIERRYLKKATERQRRRDVELKQQGL